MVLAARGNSPEAAVLMVVPAVLYKRIVVVMAALMVVVVAEAERVTIMTPIPARRAKPVRAQYV